MSFRHVRFLPVLHRYVTISKSHISFKNRTLEQYGLMEYDFVELGVDPGLHRLYFRFVHEEVSGSLPFKYRSKNSRGRVIPVRGLFAKYEWIATVRNAKINAKKQFLLEETEPMSDQVPKGFDYFITVETNRHKGVRFKPEYFPRAGGIYWLRNEYGDIVRIGESENMAAHLYLQGRSLGSRIVTFDFEIIEDKEQRLAQELDYLEGHRQLYGAPPPYNPILLKKKKKAEPEEKKPEEPKPADAADKPQAAAAQPVRARKAGVSATGPKATRPKKPRPSSSPQRRKNTASR